MRQLPPPLALALALALLAACRTTAPPPPDTPPPAQPASRLSMEALASAAYPSRYVEGGVRLAGGQAAVPAKDLKVVLVEDVVAHADVDGDGDLDAAVVLASTTGGSATFYDLALVENADGEARTLDSVHLGDRVQIEELTLEGPRIRVRYLGHGPEDAMCCPTEETRRSYLLSGGRLVPEK